MRNGEPIGFVEGENSPELREINQAIQEANGWIAEDRQYLQELETRIEVEEEDISYATEHDLASPGISVDDLKNRLEVARKNLQRDLELRDELIRLQQNFQSLDLQKNLQEIKMKHFLKSTPLKPVD